MSRNDSEDSPACGAHAERCADCRAGVDRFRDVASRLAPAPVEVPPFVDARVRAIARPPRRRWLAAAAALLIGATGAWFALDHQAPILRDNRLGRLGLLERSKP